MTSRPVSHEMKPTPGKKRRHDEENDIDSPTASQSEPTTKNSSKKHKRDKSSKKQAKAELLAKIPTHDPEGIPYSKIQLRRMKRRVKNGLDPIPTEEEEREIERRKEEDKREVDACLFGNEDDEDAANDDDEEEDDAEKENTDGTEEEDQDSADGGQGERQPPHVASDNPARNADKQRPPQPRSKKTKRAKPVPPDYICQACQNKPSDGSDFAPHWIYDCPLKITQRGCNSVAKRLRGLHDPPSRKVFVSGLPFDVTEGTVKRFFEESIISRGENSGKNIGEVVHVKLMKFEDSQRCKGQGILTFDSDEGAKAALNLNGCLWGAEDGSGKDKKKKKSKKVEEKKEVKELRLKVSKALNRFVTKKKN